MRLVSRPRSGWITIRYERHLLPSLIIDEVQRAPDLLREMREIANISGTAELPRLVSQRRQATDREDIALEGP